MQSYTVVKLVKEFCQTMFSDKPTLTIPFC